MRQSLAANRAGADQKRRPFRARRIAHQHAADNAKGRRSRRLRSAALVTHRHRRWRSSRARTRRLASARPVGIAVRAAPELTFGRAASPCVSELAGLLAGLPHMHE